MERIFYNFRWVKKCERNWVWIPNLVDIELREKMRQAYSIARESRIDSIRMAFAQRSSEDFLSGNAKPFETKKLRQRATKGDEWHCVALNEIKISKFSMTNFETLGFIVAEQFVIVGERFISYPLKFLRITQRNKSIWSKDHSGTNTDWYHNLGGLSKYIISHLFYVLSWNDGSRLPRHFSVTFTTPVDRVKH